MNKEASVAEERTIDEMLVTWRAWLIDDLEQLRIVSQRGDMTAEQIQFRRREIVDTQSRVADALRLLRLKLWEQTLKV